MSTFTPAKRSESFLKAAVYGPSGSGKTTWAIWLAKQLGKKVAVIDTEHGRASNHAGVEIGGVKLEFDTLVLEDHSIKSYQSAIVAAHQEGYDAIVVDSLSHAWDEILRRSDAMGSDMRKWGELNKEIASLVSVITRVPAHVVTTMRTKTTYVEERAKNGKLKFVPAGLDPKFKSGIEYEFSLLAMLERDHNITFIKSLPGSGLDGYVGDSLGAEIPEMINAWFAGE